MNVTAKVEGLGALDQALKGIPRSTGKRMLTNAWKKAATPLLDMMKFLAPDDPETAPPYDLKSSLQIGTDTTPTGWGDAPRPYDAIVFVGATKFGNPQAGFTEYGTVKMVAIPWGRPAWDSQNGRVLNIFKTDLWAAIERDAVRYGKAAPR